MSDCGGFYDLITGPQRNGAQPPAAQPVQPQPRAPRPEPVKQVPASGGQKNFGLISLVVSCVGFLLLLVLVLSMKSQLNAGLSQVEENSKDIEALTSDVQQLKETDSVEATEPTVVEEPKLEEQAVVIHIDPANGKDGDSVKTADLGEVEQEVTSQVSLDDENSLTDVSISVGQAKNCIVAKFKRVVGSEQDPEEVVLSTAVDVASEIFAASQGQPEYSWSYREEGSEEWIDLDKDVFTCEASDDGATVTFKAGDLDKLLGEDTQDVQFRLTYTRRTEQDGSLTLVITGITIPRKDLKIKPVEPVDSILFN